MFDIGFWELLTIFVIGVVVVGPQKLPEVVKELYSFLGRIRRMYENAKNDLSRELELDEIKKAAQQADMSEHIKKINQSVLDMERSGKDLLRGMRSEELGVRSEDNDDEITDAEEDWVNAELSEEKDATAIATERSKEK